MDRGLISYIAAACGFSFVIFISSPVFTSQQKDTFSCLWENAQKILYSDPELWNIDFPSTLKDEVAEPLPPATPSLVVNGRKVIGVKYTRFSYPDPWVSEDKPTSSTEVEQELQIKARGKVGRRVTVNLDYDDTAPRTEQQKINLVYKGDENEFIQEVALGDIHLSLPKTHFTSYDKSLFGAKIKAGWGNFYFTGIGSLTRGLREVKTFTGKTTTEEREIPDTGYTKRTYFKVFFDQNYTPDDFGNLSFSYTEGSVEVWIDDQDGSNNQSASWMTVEPVSGDTSYTGWFDLQYAGQDYIVDYARGVIKFTREVGENFVIAVAYKDADGNRYPSSGYRMIMKGPDENYYKYRLWNYYYLGSEKISQENFVFQIRDLSGNVVYDWEKPEEYPDYEVRIDFDFGIAQIINPATYEDYYKPFPDAYPPAFLHKFTLYTSYTYTVDTYLLHPDMIPGSERVYVDDNLLTRDEDYIVDYSSGYLNFLDPDLIGPGTKIKVEYEWAPLMGGQATFFGGRLEYRPGKSFSIGSTFLSQTATSTGTVPPLGSSPSSHQVWEADLNLNFKPNLGFLWGGNFPADVLFAAEVSQSNINPNIFGACMLEDFSTSKIEDILPLGKDSWKLGSQPQGVDSTQRNEVIISDERLKAEEVNPSWSSDEITVLELSYDFTSGASWDCIVCPISFEGKDYSDMRYLEVWTRGGENIEVYLDIGIVSEDVDGDEKLDTEDKNGDGILNPGEDTGIVMNFPLAERIIGANNGKLDTEDLDQDGVLDTDESFCTYLLSDEYKETTPTGWYKYTIPLNSRSDWDNVKNLVKHVRIWATGSNFSGKIEFARISISGDRWQVSGLETKAVNNWDDLDFPDPLEDPDFTSYYEEMYGDTKTSEGKLRRESALFLQPASGQTSGYIQQTFISTKDFSDYRQINLWLYRVSGEGDFYIRFGSDVGVNYYSYTLPLNSLDLGSWVKVEIPFSELKVTGAPTLNGIKQIRIGLGGNASSSSLYINDIYLDKVQEKRGQAQRYLVKTNFSKYLSLSAEYEKVDPPFSVIGGSSTDKIDQKLEVKKWELSSSIFDFLPLSYSHSEKYTSTQDTSGSSFTPVEKDKILERSRNYMVGFHLRSLPALTFRGSNKTSDYLSAEPFERTFEDVYDLSFNYDVPWHTPLLPTNVSLFLKLKKSGKEVENTSTSVDITRGGSITLPFRPSATAMLKSSYSQFETNHSENGGRELPKSRSRNLSLNCQLSIFKLTPRFAFKGGYKEENFSFNPERRKISTSFNLSSSLPVHPSMWVKLPEIFSTLRWYLDFNLKREGIYEDTTASLDFPSQLGWSRLELPDGEEKLWLEKKAYNMKQSWSPFSFLETTLSYGREREEKTQLGTPWVRRTENWPAVKLKFDLNRTPFLIDRISKRFFSSSNLVLEYSRTNTISEGISTSISHQPFLSWQGTFKKPEDLSLAFLYKSSTRYQKVFGETSSSRDFSSTHQLKISWSTYIAWGAKIPLLSSLINFKNKLTFSAALSRDLSYKEDSSGLVQQDQEKWALIADVSYRMTRNINMKLGLDLTCYKDRVKVGEDYFGYGGFAWVEILF